MVAITRLSSAGYGSRRSGDFSGKAEYSGDPSREIPRITRLGSWGHGTRLAGDFSGKLGTRRVISRLGGWGHGTRLAGDFSGKALSAVDPTPGRYPPSPFRRETLRLRKRPEQTPDVVLEPPAEEIWVEVPTKGAGLGNALLEGFTRPAQPSFALPPAETDDDEEVLMAMLMVI